MNPHSIHSALLAAGLALGFSSQPLRADTSGNFTYTDNGTSITITGYPSTATGPVNIPATIKNKPVKSIADYAFYLCGSLTKVTIPATVNSIGARAFYKCSSMTGVNIPAGVPSIGDQTFYQCTNLASVTLPASVSSIGVSAFSACSSLTQVTIPSKVTSIAEYTFRYCSGLTSVTIPSKVTSIGTYSFDGCTSLTTLKIPGSVTTIGGYAFTGCTTLSDLTLSSGLTTISAGAFSGCGKLTGVTIPASVTTILSYAFGRSEAAVPCGLTEATFLGNAPSMGSLVFDNSVAGFTVYYLTGKTGFASPTWLGYPAVAETAAPEIDVQQPQGTSLVDGVSKKSFGTVKVGQTSTAKSFTIENRGTSNLTGLKITKTGSNPTNFTCIAPNPTTLPPGASVSFKVTFAPDSTGTRSATIHITSNDANENPFDIKLAGMGAP